MTLLPAVATFSLGRSSAGHTLFEKLRKAADHSFRGVEVAYECLEYHARSLPGGLNADNLLKAAEQTREECDRLDLQILCIQPFMFAEGNTQPGDREEVMQRFKFWLKLAKLLRTDIIQSPSNFRAQGTTGDMDIIVADMAELARLAAQQTPLVKIAWEGVAWGNHIDTWEGTWEVVKRVNMSNLGLCLDTFHIAGRLWADPLSPSGRIPDGDKALKESLARMAAELDVAKVFYVQAGDAELLDPPLGPEHALYVPDQPKRMTWARNSRLFAFETDRGGYLPTTPILDVIVRTLGFQGWLAMEYFSKDLYDGDETLPQKMAERAELSWKKIQELYE